MRKLLLTGLAPALLVLAGCGGGGSGSTITPGGGGSTSTTDNSTAISVNLGPDGNDADTPFITVTVCAPGSTTNCQTIDDVEVDTGSYGLRIISTVLSASLASALQPETSGANSVVECTQFEDGFSWGPIVHADVQIAGESASDVPVQVMGDSSYESEIPAACTSTGTEEDTIATFGANAIIGIGPFADDCGPYCAETAGNGWYYACPAGGTSTSDCTGIDEAESEQTTDPVTDFQTDNNGVIVELSSAAEGAASSSGTLIFGIGTEGNNAMTATTMLTADSSYGDITTDYTTTGGEQMVLPYSYLDTGSNAFYFADNGIPANTSCSSYEGYDSSDPSSWFCPTTELNLGATNIGQNGTESTVSFSIGNAYTVFYEYPDGSVFDDLGASSGSQPTDCSTGTTDFNCSFDFGFPFFLGRNVFVGFATTSNDEVPYFAY